jgi:RNA polymerase subunit RPABC4/transcription elongation factor Spt4
MVKYMCKNCNYKHLSEVNECRFCGMDNLEEEKSAVDLLDEMDKLFGG